MVGYPTGARHNREDIAGSVALQEMSSICVTASHAWCKHHYKMLPCNDSLADVVQVLSGPQVHQQALLAPLQFQAFGHLGSSSVLMQHSWVIWSQGLEQELCETET